MRSTPNNMHLQDIANLLDYDAQQYVNDYFEAAAREAESADDEDGGDDDPPIQGKVKVELTYTFGYKPRTSGFNLGIGAGINARKGFGQLSANAAVNIYNTGLGMPNGQRDIHLLRVDYAITPALTFGFGKSSTPAPINTMQLGMLSGIISGFAHSLTHAQNFVFSNRNAFQRVGAYNFKIGDFSLNAYNDRNFFGGDNEDRWWTGGASITIVNLMGNKDNMLRFGNDVFTGNSYPTMKSQESKRSDALMSTYNYQSNKPALNYTGQMDFDPIGKPGYNQSLNMGQTYLSMNMGCDLFLIKHVGKFDMWSQNAIHDLTDFHRFLSTVPNQFMVTGGLNTSKTW